MSNFDTININHLTKYTNDRIITWAQFVEEVAEIYPVNIPIYDILTMYVIGDYSHFLSNYYKWLECEDMYDQIKNKLAELYPNINFDYAQINNLIINNKNLHEDPALINSKLFNLIDNQYFNTIPKKIMDKSQSKDYMDFRFGIQDMIKNIINTYSEKWSYHKTMSDIVGETLALNFMTLEEDENFINTFEMLDNVENKASEKIEDKIKTYSQLFLEKINYNSLSITNPLEQMKNKIAIKNDLQKDFRNDIDNIYFQELRKLNFPEFINQILDNHFSVSKEMHMLSFTLENMIGSFEQVINSSSD